MAAWPPQGQATHTAPPGFDMGYVASRATEGQLPAVAPATQEHLRPPAAPAAEDEGPFHRLGESDSMATPVLIMRSADDADMGHSSQWRPSQGTTVQEGVAIDHASGCGLVSGPGTCSGVDATSDNSQSSLLRGAQPATTAPVDTTTLPSVVTMHAPTPPSLPQFVERRTETSR